MTKWLALLLAVILVYLQYRFWWDDGGYRDWSKLQEDIATQHAENARLIERNRALAAEVKALQEENAAIEARARKDLGMIKEGETFYMVVPKEPSADANSVSQ